MAALSDIKTVTFGDFTLYLTGETVQGQEVWRHVPGTAFKACEKALTERKGTYGAHALKTGEWSFGWTFPEKVEQPAQPLHLDTVVVSSDRDDTVKYHVTVDTMTGDPVSCTCPAGEHGRLCKHLYRGQVRVMGTLREAAIALLQKEVLPNIAGFWAQYNKIASEEGHNVAIERAIRAGLGVEHPYATDWKARQYNLRAKQARR